MRKISRGTPEAFSEILKRLAPAKNLDRLRDKIEISKFACAREVEDSSRRTDVMNCPVCGELIEEGYRFCRTCGGRLPVAEDSAAILAFPIEATAPAAAPLGPPSQPSPRAYRLIATSGLLSGRAYSIGPRGLVIGRDPANCQVVLADDEISRLHAWIAPNDKGEVVLLDRHSANGTFVNQVRVQEKVLKPEDEISMGSARRHLFRIEEVGTAGLPQGVVPPPEAFAASGAFPLPSRFWKDEGPYLAIMTSFALFGFIAILVVMKHKDVT
jgi:hypothetical protein